MRCVRKYMFAPTFDDLEWIMHTFQRRCDVQSVPTYSNVHAFNSNNNYHVVIDNKTYIIVQNDKDDMFFKLRFPDAVLVEQTWLTD